MGMDLEIRHLRTVVAVADHGGYSAAAQHMRIAQSSLSRTVQDVERRVGVTLFARTTRSVRPTPDGLQFLQLARSALGEFDAALAHFDGYLRGHRGTVAVATLPSLAAGMLPPVLAAYRRERPDVAVTVSDGLSTEVLGLVRDGSVDLALTVATEPSGSLESTRIAVDRFSCVFPPGHRFGGHRRLTWADLAGEAFVAFDRTSSIRAYADRVLDDQAVRLGTVTEARNIGAVAGLVAAGLGVSVVPALVLPMMRFAGVRHRALVGPVLERDIGLIRDPRRPVAPAVAALIAMLRGAEEHAIALPSGARWTP